MKELTLEESKQLLLDMLIWFDDFCRKNEIKYSVGEGTLIGAMRHKGFVPWDDDIDVIMTRDQLNKFCSLYHGEKYRLIGLETEKKWVWPYVRITDELTWVRMNDNKCDHGLWIALLAIDNCPDDDKELKKMMKQISFWTILARIRYSKWIKSLSLPRNIIKQIARILLPFSCHYIGKKILKITTRYNGINTKRRMMNSCCWHAPWVFEAKAMDEYIDVDFEGYTVMAIRGYDTYLRCQYGDWMQLPPLEKRINKHDYIAYWKD